MISISECTLLKITATIVSKKSWDRPIARQDNQSTITWAAFQRVRADLACSQTSQWLQARATTMQIAKLAVTPPRSMHLPVLRCVILFSKPLLHIFTMLKLIFDVLVWRRMLVWKHSSTLGKPKISQTRGAMRHVLAIHLTAVVHRDGFQYTTTPPNMSKEQTQLFTDRKPRRPLAIMSCRVAIAKLLLVVP